MLPALTPVGITLLAPRPTAGSISAQQQVRYHQSLYAHLCGRHCRSACGFTVCEILNENFVLFSLCGLLLLFCYVRLKMVDLVN